VVMSVRDPATDVVLAGLYEWSADGRVVYFVLEWDQDRFALGTHRGRRSTSSARMNNLATDQPRTGKRIGRSADRHVAIHAALYTV
jgi:hypothetical protein